MASHQAIRRPRQVRCRTRRAGLSVPGNENHAPSGRVHHRQTRAATRILFCSLLAPRASKRGARYPTSERRRKLPIQVRDVVDGSARHHWYLPIPSRRPCILIWKPRSHCEHRNECEPQRSPGRPCTASTTPRSTSMRGPMRRRCCRSTHVCDARNAVSSARWTDRIGARAPGNTGLAPSGGHANARLGWR